MQPGRTRRKFPHLVDWRVREAVGAQVVRPLDRRRRLLVTALAAEPLPAFLRQAQALHCLGVAHVVELARVLVEEKAFAQLVPAQLGQLAVLRTEVLDRPHVETAEYMQCACTSTDRVHAQVQPSVECGRLSSTVRGGMPTCARSPWRSKPWPRLLVQAGASLAG